MDFQNSKAKKTIITEKIFYHYVKVNILYKVVFLLNKFAGYQLFLYLYSKDIKFKVANFSKENAKDFEDKYKIGFLPKQNP